MEGCTYRANTVQYGRELGNKSAETDGGFVIEPISFFFYIKITHGVTI